MTDITTHQQSPPQQHPSWAPPPLADGLRRPPVTPGRVTPRRAVPDSIIRPDYALDPRGVPQLHESRNPKTTTEIAVMRRVGRLAAEVLQIVGAAVKPGVTADELDEIAHEQCLRRGGYPSTLGYRRFPKSIGISINDVVCHGVPDDTVLVDGDIVNCDFTMYLDGFHADTNITVGVGAVAPEVVRLLAVAEQALQIGIEQVRPGGCVSDIGRAVEPYVTGQGFSVVAGFTGHGVGRAFHGPPSVHGTYTPSYQVPLVEGMTFTIEPAINAGSAATRMWEDNWTVATADGSLSAQFEHTLVVTATGAEILTRC